MAKFLSVVQKKQTNKYVFSYLQMFILHTALYQRAQGCDFVNWFVNWFVNFKFLAMFGKIISSFFTQFSHSALLSFLLLASSLLGFPRIFFLLMKVERKKTLFSKWQKKGTKFLQVSLQNGKNSYLQLHDSSTHANLRNSEALSITYSVNWDFSFGESHS